MPTTNTSYYKKVRRDGKWVTIDTRTGEVVTREKRKKDYKEDVSRADQKTSDRRSKLKSFLKRNLIDRYTYSDEFDNKKKRFKTTLESDKEYEKEVANRDTGKDDAEMTPKQQKRALQISKKRDLTNIPVEKPKSEKLKVTKKDEGFNAHVRNEQKKEASSSKKVLGTETKQQYLERTKNSPAAKAFGNSAAANEKRWQARQSYLDFLARRKKKKNKK
tara:strand:- start:848 stop:1501 length:654 start_codon:yes stop_codon:yes gene_type:complete